MLSSGITKLRKYSKMSLWSTDLILERECLRDWKLQVLLWTRRLDCIQESRTSAAWHTRTTHSRLDRWMARQMSLWISNIPKSLESLKMTFIIHIFTKHLALCNSNFKVRCAGNTGMATRGSPCVFLSLQNTKRKKSLENIELDRRGERGCNHFKDCLMDCQVHLPLTLQIPSLGSGLSQCFDAKKAD